MQIGNQLKQLRKQMGLSQQELAKMLGISQSYLSGIEQGKRAFNAEVFSELLAGLNVRTQRFKSGFYPLETSRYVEERSAESGEIFLIDGNDREIRPGQTYLFEIDGRREARLAVRTGEGDLKLTNLRPKLKNNDIFPDSSMKCLGRITYIINKV